MNHAEVDLFDSKKLATAFREIRAQISEKQFEDLSHLYQRSLGIPYTLDSNNRPQGSTIRTCQLVGSLLKRHLGKGPKYGMSWLIHGNGTDTFTLRENVRAAFKIVGWFGNVQASNSATVIRETNDQNSTIHNVAEEIDVSETTYEAWREIRIGQQQFRARLLQHWRGCSVTGCLLQQVLIASHIVPWSEATDIERLDVSNGLLLTPNLDRLFDNYFISFNSLGEILISKTISSKAMHDLGINPSMKLRRTDAKLLSYLQKHERAFLEKEQAR
jgi:predicted DNA-binding protein YlxM (UPF0122 family)